MASLEKSLRPTAAIVALAALDAGCWFWCEDDRAVLAEPGRADLPALITALAALLLQTALTWLLLLTVLVALEPLAGRDLASYAGCPAALRTTLLACCGVAAAGVLAGPAQATPITPTPVLYGPGTHVVHPGAHADQRGSAVLDGLPLPDRTTGGAAPSAARPTSDTSGTTVLVRPGDTLWDIAARHLAPDQVPGPDVTSAVQHAWRALYVENRSQIGPDPDLIQPGTRLWLPPTPQQEDHR
ncbi:MAG: LysM peptidoglycan-binding domain-containing protein [Marmoricola sp.]